MEADRQACDRLVPGLREELAGIPLAELESPDSPAIELFRRHGGGNLLVPAAFGGLDASALEAVRTVRALSCVAPSMSVATAMHHFSVGTLFGVVDIVGQGTDLNEMLLGRIVSERMLVASGFAEGRANQGILSPTLQARPADGGYLLTGSKKPCSMSRSMDLLTASVALAGPDGATEMGFLMLPADTPGITVRPFWSSFALAGAESDEVQLKDVFVTDAQILRPPPDRAGELSDLQEVGLIWFEMIICATYVGVASALVEKVLRRGRGPAAERSAVAMRIAAAAELTEALARRVMDGDVGNDALAATLAARFTVQDLVAATVGQAVELLGGMAYVSSSDVGYLAAASHAIAFHPPSRTSMIDGFLAYCAGEPLIVP
jgi:alkylation response protein AidB-like acyl-CoA dehydrogenase